MELEEVGWLAAAVLAPLVLNPAGCSVFELPKAVVVQACALAAWAPVVVSRRGTGRRSPLIWPLLALAGIAVLASFASIDRGLSLWGSLDRQQGLLTLLAYAALAAAVAVRLRTPGQALRLLRAGVGQRAGRPVRPCPGAGRRSRPLADGRRLARPVHRGPGELPRLLPGHRLPRSRSLPA